MPLQELVWLTISLLRRVVLRHWVKHWLKTLALISVVAIGTCVYLSISLANRAATSSFESFTESISGRSQLVVSASTGSLKTDDLIALRRALADTEAFLIPIIETVAARGQSESLENRSYFPLVGVDLLALSNLLARYQTNSTYWNANSQSDQTIWDTLRSPNAFFSERLIAQTESWDKSPEVTFFVGERRVELTWAGSYPKPDNQPDRGSSSLVMDWEDLAALTGRQGEIDRVDIVVPNTSGQQKTWTEQAISHINNANPGHWIVESHQDRQRTGSTMSLALRMNLRALSYLALAVALILVFQALETAVTRRHKEIATLRALGVSPRQTRILWLAESALLGGVGGALGIALSSLVARFAIGAVSETVNLLYYFTDNATVSFLPGEAFAAWGLSIVCCFAAGWHPATEASRNPPAQMLRRGSYASTYSKFRYVVAAIGFAFISYAAWLTPPFNAPNGHAIPIGGYLMAISLIGFAVASACIALDFLGRITGFIGNWSATLRLGLSPFRRPATRHRLALGGVIVSVGMTLSMAFLISSFESTVRNWIGSVLQADIFVGSKAMNGLYSNARIDPNTAQALLADPDIIAGGVLQSTTTRIQEHPTMFNGYDTPYLLAHSHFIWLEEPDNLANLSRGPNALINESFAQRFSVSQGDTVTLASSNGPVEVSVLGVFADYGSEQGSIGVNGALYQKITGDTRIRNIAAHLRPGAALNEVLERWRSDYPGLQINANQSLRNETLKIFRSVFSITYALQGIGLFISVSGLSAMLFTALLERKPLLDALRRMGTGRRQIARAALTEGVALATLGSLVGAILGGALGLVLVFVINKQSFGWTLDVSIPWGQIATIASSVIGCAALTSYSIGYIISGWPLQREE